MLSDIIEYYAEKQPDILAGWNSSGGAGRNYRYRPGFDIQYLIARMKKLRLDYTRLSPIGEVYFRKNGEVIIKLVQLIDLMYFYRKSRSKEPKFLGLDYVAKKHVKARKVKRKGRVIELQLSNPRKAREYNAVDAELCALIDRNLKLIRRRQRSADNHGIFLQDTLKYSLGWDVEVSRYLMA